MNVVGDLAPQVFVVGSFRGGTTLLERLLLAHPVVTGPGFETQLFSRVRYGRQLDHPDEYASFVEPVRAAGSRLDPIAEFAAAADLLARSCGAYLWVEKSPEHVYHVASIFEHFPKARILYIVRDGRDVVTSILHTPWVMPRVRGRFARIVAGAVLWELMTSAGLRLLAKYPGPSMVMPIRYEDLASRPAAHLGSLARFIGLSQSEEASTDWIRQAAAISGNSLIDPSVHGLACSPIGRSSDRRLIQAGELALIQYLIGFTLVRAGYALVPVERLPAATRARAAAAKALWLTIRMQRYAANVGRGAPPYLASDARAALVPLLRPEASAK